MDVACGGSVPEGYGDPKPSFSRAEQVLDDRLRHRFTITTSCGEISVELYSGEAPRTANNFAFLADNGFYDATVIHRVVPGFVVQMGDPTGTGTGGPGYRFADEPVTRPYAPGSLAMANAGPDTNGSQFFVVLEGGAAQLQPLYNHFGQVVSGMDVVAAIGLTDPSVDPTTIQTVTIAQS